MAKRARYDGPFAEVVVEWPPGETADSEDKQRWTVKQGGLLPADAPAKLRDELASSADWSDVDHKSGSQDKEG